MTEEIKFNIFRPVNLNTIFEIPEDRSIWVKNPRYIKNESKNCVPNRDYFLKSSELLIPRNKKTKDYFKKNSVTNYGIYILIFNDFKKFYVGVAARYSYIKDGSLREIKKPEGFLTRLRKHRAKCTGTFYNISHTNTKPYGWRDLALERVKLYAEKKKTDTMSDCLLSLILFENHENYEDNDKGILEEIEHYINNNGISKYFGEDYSDYESFAHTNPKGLKFIPKFEMKNFSF